MDEKLISRISACSACKEGRYQTPPMTYAGKLSAPVLVVAQNPGEIKSGDNERRWWLDHLNDKKTYTSAELMKMWYDWDFGTSSACAKLGHVFGRDWLKSGIYVFTNAVLCRTQHNHPPYPTMIQRCSHNLIEIIKVWMLERDTSKISPIIVAIGNIPYYSLRQIFALDSIHKLGNTSVPNKEKSVSIGEAGTFVMMQHFAAHTFLLEAPRIREDFLSLLKAKSLD